MKQNKRGNSIFLTENIKMAFQAIRAYKVRSALSCLGIGIGVFSIILIMTMMNGMKGYIHKQFDRFGGSSLYVHKMDFMKNNSPENHMKMRRWPSIRLKEYNAIKNESIIVDHVGLDFGDDRSSIRYKSKSADGKQVMGTNAAFHLATNLKVGSGRFFTESEVHSAERVVFVGSEIVEELFPNESAINKRIKIDGFKYRIIGVKEKEGQSLGNSLDETVYVPYTTLHNYKDINNSAAITAFVKDASKLPELTDELTGILRKVRKIPPTQESNFGVNNINNFAKMFDEITKVAYWVVFGISCVSLFVGGIGIMNIMIVSVTERTKEIGIRKSLGAKQGSILSQFLSEAVTLSVIGGLPGILLGVAGAVIGMSAAGISIDITAEPFIIGFSFSVFVGIVSGFIPAYKASRMVPVDALRFD